MHRCTFWPLRSDSATGRWSKFAKMSKSCHFQKHGHIWDSQYPLRIGGGGGWGLSMFNKYFLVFLSFPVPVKQRLTQLVARFAKYANNKLWGSDSTPMISTKRVHVPDISIIIKPKQPDIITSIIDQAILPRPTPIFYHLFSFIIYIIPYYFLQLSLRQNGWRRLFAEWRHWRHW